MENGLFGSNRTWRTIGEINGAVVNRTSRRSVIVSQQRMNGVGKRVKLRVAGTAHSAGVEVDGGVSGMDVAMTVAIL